MSDAPIGRRRSGLLQERSRRTRQALVRAAIALWSERGFETGIEDTTVEEIVQAAGVTKGTFYFHFARKEEILLEMGWETAQAVYHEAMAAIDTWAGVDDALARIVPVLSRRIRAAPRAAVARAAAEFRRHPAGGLKTDGRVSFVDAFGAVFARGQEEGELTEGRTPEEAAQMLQALVMDSIMDWAVQGVELEPALKRRTAVLLGGLRALPTSAAKPARSSR